MEEPYLTTERARVNKARTNTIDLPGGVLIKEETFFHGLDRRTCCGAAGWVLRDEDSRNINELEGMVVEVLLREDVLMGMKYEGYCFYDAVRKNAHLVPGGLDVSRAMSELYED